MLPRLRTIGHAVSFENDGAGRTASHGMAAEFGPFAILSYKIRQWIHPGFTNGRSNVRRRIGTNGRRPGLGSAVRSHVHEPFRVQHTGADAHGR